MRTREKWLSFGGGSDSDGRMIRGGFFIDEDRKALIALARDGLAAGRVTRRANALALLDRGMSCQQVAEVLLFDDDTIRGWYGQFEQDDAPTMRSFEGLGWGDPPALDASHRRLDRQGIWPCLRKPLGADRAAASPGARISQAGSHLAQARPQNAEGVYRELRRPVEFQGRRRGRDIRGRGASHPRGAARGLLGPEGTEARDRTDERARAHQHPRRDRSRNRPDPHDRSRNDRRDIDDPAAGIAGIALSADGLHPRIPRQRALSSRQTREGMAGPIELPDQAAFPAHLFPAPEPDRAAMGRHAQEHYPQQMLRDLRRIRGNNPRIPARRGAQKVGRVLRFGHRQFSYNFTQGFSAPGVNRVYKNGGRELCAKSSPEHVNVYDFVDPQVGRATPYGVYDITQNKGWVSVGT